MAPTGAATGPADSPLILHATTVAMGGRAVIIRGPSGSGKSGLALQLMAMGAALVADDRTRLWREGGRVMADAPDTIRGRIEARFVGLLAALACGPAPVGLVVDMGEPETDRLPPRRETAILGVDLPLVRKSDAPHFPAAIRLYLSEGRVD